LKEKEKGCDYEKEDVSSFWMILRKREHPGN
jgi:hypothetical protein